MLKYALALTSIFIVSASLYGWGSAIRLLLRLSRGAWPVTIALGLSLYVYLGGVANISHIAYGITLDAILILGIIFLIVRYRETIAELRLQAFSTAHALLAVEILLIAGFVVATQLPPAAFNFHDDFEKYFAHPVRMLQTGTLQGSPLSALGSEALGGQAMLHGLVLSHFPIQYINGVDAVFGLMLCMVLVAEMALQRKNHVIAAALVTASVFAINPQYVNISALYLGGALIAATVLLTADSRELKTMEDKEKAPSAIALGLVYAALIALKPVFAIFVVLHAVLSSLAMASPGIRQIRLGMRWLLNTGLWTTFFLAPWLLLHYRHYLDSTPPWHAANVSTPVSPPGLVKLLSIETLPYGATVAHYTFMVVALLLGCLLLLRSRRSSVPAAAWSTTRGVVVASITAFAGYILLCIVLAPYLSGYRAGLRYAIPMVIGTVPVALALNLPDLPGEVSRTRKMLLQIASMTSLVIVVIFAPSLVERVKQAVSSGSALSFSMLAKSAHYLAYNQQVLSEGMERTIAAIQNLIPAGEPVVAWISTPFYLDYTRNTILDADPAGVATRWARIPPDVRYFMWEYQGDAARDAQSFQRMMLVEGARDRVVALKGLQFLNFLADVKTKSDVVYDDGKLLLLRVKAPS